MEYGAEIALFEERVKMSANLTSTETKDYSTDMDLPKVPQNQFNININFKPIPKFAIGASVNHTGGYFDIGTDKIKQFTLVSLRADYTVSEHFNIFGRIENLFNKHYEKVRGYGEPGIGAYGGINAKF